jgi:hypothetical protein
MPEGGIRTLGTGVSPYNGLENESFPPPSLVVKHLQSTPCLQVGLRASHAVVIVLHFVLQIPVRIHHKIGPAARFARWINQSSKTIGFLPLNSFRFPSLPPRQETTDKGRNFTVPLW